MENQPDLSRMTEEAQIAWHLSEVRRLRMTAVRSDWHAASEGVMI